MKKLLLASLFLVALGWNTQAQTKGAIDAKTLQEIRNSFQPSDAEKALQNAITNSKSLREVAKCHYKL